MVYNFSDNQLLEIVAAPTVPATMHLNQAVFMLGMV